MTAEKICVVCGADCATLPRLKDSQGRYACKTCVEAKRSAATGDKAMPKASPAPKPRPAASAAGAANAGFSMDAYLDGIHTPDANPCPKCGAGRAADAVVCMQCGFDSASGRAMTTKVGKDKPKRTRSSAPRVSSGMVYVIIALAMLVLLPLVALASPEAAALAFIATILWHLVAYVYMVGSAFRDDDKFWGILGVLFWVPLAGAFCVLAFALYYCTIGSQRGIRKLNFWASLFAQLFVMGILVMHNPDLLSGVTPGDTP